MSTILGVSVQIVHILCNSCSLVYLFPTTFRLFAFPICFPPFALNQISTQSSSSFVQFRQCYVILLFTPGVQWGSCYSINSFVCVCFVDRCLSFCPFFFWPLCCLSFFELRILIIPLVSSSSPCFCVVHVIVLFIFLRHFVIHHDCEVDKPFQSITLSCVSEHRWDNQEWTIQRYWQRWVHKTQEVDVKKTKDIS